MHFSFSQTRVGDGDLEKAAGGILGYQEEIRKIAQQPGYASPESFINLPGDGEVYEKVHSLLKEKGKKTKIVVVMGIGGSNLGAQAIYDALKEEKGLHPVWFLDAVSTERLTQFKKLLSTIRTPEEIVAIVISKSGATLETVFNSGAVSSLLEKQFGEKAFERFIVISDKGSDLWKKAEERGIATLEIPEKIGGRFSVFSPVGLAPLAFSGIDLQELRSGAEGVKDECLTENIQENPALKSAALLFSYVKQGRGIHDIFLASPELESLGKWYRALLAESLGKEGKGITPTVSIGTTDMHSVGQLMHGGPRDKSMEIVSIEEREENIILPESPFLAGENEKRLLSGCGAEKLNSALLEGIRKSYAESETPFFEVTLPRKDERSLGAFMMYKMCEVMWLAKLFGVNGFDQPDVERYKRYARDILGKRK